MIADDGDDGVRDFHPPPEFSIKPALAFAGLLLLVCCAGCGVLAADCTVRT
jgi:hypothetical protein